MTELIAEYINKPSFPIPPSTQRYDLRNKNWMVPFQVPLNHKVVVYINGQEITDFHYYNSVVTLAAQPKDYDRITITTMATESSPKENESNDSE